MNVKKLLQTLHEHFIPSKKNAYQPHFLRLRVTAGVLGLVLCVEVLYLAVSFVVIPQSGRLAAIFASVLVDQTNLERVHENMNGLISNDTLVRAAQLKADDMASKGYFAHVSPEGKTPWYWFKEAGYDYAAAGENLAVNFTDSKDVTSAWMRSESHRANILNGNYTEIGIATAQGIYKGKEAIFVVQEFGRPAPISQVVEPLLKSEPATLTPVIGMVQDVPIPIPKNSTVVKSTTSETVRSMPINAPPRVLQASAATSSTLVAGAETTKLGVPVAPIASPVLEETHLSFLDRLMTSPRQTSTVIYLVLAAFLVFALGLAFFIKIRIQHPHILANGILTIAILISLILLNSALGSQGIIY